MRQETCCYPTGDCILAEELRKDCIPSVYNGKTAKEWYELYAQLLIKTTTEQIKKDFPNDRNSC